MGSIEDLEDTNIFVYADTSPSRLSTESRCPLLSSRPLDPQAEGMPVNDIEAPEGTVSRAKRL